MNRLPTPFTVSEEQGISSNQPSTGQTSSFLSLRNTVAVQGNNPLTETMYRSNSGDDFVPFNHTNGNYHNTPGNSFRGNRGRNPRYSRGGSPRYSTPYNHNHFDSPNRRYDSNSYGSSSPRGHSNAFNQSPQGFIGNFNQSRGFNRSRNSFDNQSHGGKTPLKEIPIDKFILPSMTEDPWAEFDNSTDSEIEDSQLNASCSSAKEHIESEH